MTNDCRQFSLSGHAFFCPHLDTPKCLQTRQKTTKNATAEFLAEALVRQIFIQ